MLVSDLVAQLLALPQDVEVAIVFDGVVPPGLHSADIVGAEYDGEGDVPRVYVSHCAGWPRS